VVDGLGEDCDLAKLVDYYVNNPNSETNLSQIINHQKTLHLSNVAATH